jgi:hypothetical protein
MVKSIYQPGCNPVMVTEVVPPDTMVSGAKFCRPIVEMAVIDAEVISGLGLVQVSVTEVSD